MIHYDPWWNPAVETRATDRAHRIGQDKPVFVYKLITEGTVEEKILALQAKKQQLAHSLYGSKQEGDQLLIDVATISALLASVEKSCPVLAWLPLQLGRLVIIPTPARCRPVGHCDRSGFRG